ncbi:hypothetical protein DAEQUDRAFT_721609 [Daedalea quercina L-15889]|uniref:Uncharacterized protein n=1 Tax=Daedalea quercina L-15889 TaxID=1314783 RepID=A0A165TJW9_9APHY|nr:hypothetical protein DAEQUDRAFT_721609 [Daedalea quercina L-15889]
MFLQDIIRRLVSFPAIAGTSLPGPRRGQPPNHQNMVLIQGGGGPTLGYNKLMLVSSGGECSYVTNSCAGERVGLARRHCT